MIHPISRVASENFLDATVCQQIAETSSNVIKLTDGGFYVSTAQVAGFLAEVRTAQGDAAANQAIRQREISRYMGRLAAA